MKKIFVKIPRNEKDKWKLGFWARPRSMARADTLLGRLERSLPKLILKGKTAIVIKEYIDSHWENINETLPSKDVSYLFYVTTCFLEDYLSDTVLRRVNRKCLRKEYR